MAAPRPEDSPGEEDLGPRVLIVDDEDLSRQGLAVILDKSGYRIDQAENGVEALAKIEDVDYAVVLADYKMPRMDGLELIQRVTQSRPLTKVIMITGRGTIETAVEAMKLGASDFVTKPFEMSEIRAKVEKAVADRAIVEENLRLKQELATRFVPDSSFVWRDEKMKDLVALVAKIAPTNNSVLIEGESGTGKELIARSIHESSTRRNKPFLAINCAAFSVDLLQDALFGHEKGAYTGADSRKPGIFEAVGGGTILMDEIGDLPLSLQPTFLRVLQEHEIYRLGGHQPVKVDFRLVTATNRNLKKMVEEDRFRNDLYFRIRVNYVKLPPLRERYADIPLLANFFLKKYNVIENRTLEGFTKEALNILGSYTWPGNVRELENVVKQMVVLGESKYLGQEDIPEIILEALDESEDFATLEHVRLEHIKKVLRSVHGNRTKASKILGIPRVSLQRIISREKELSSIKAYTEADTDLSG